MNRAEMCEADLATAALVTEVEMEDEIASPKDVANRMVVLKSEPASA